jgi:hypothetical protein
MKKTKLTFFECELDGIYYVREASIFEAKLRPRLMLEFHLSIQSDLWTFTLEFDQRCCNVVKSC